MRVPDTGFSGLAGSEAVAFFDYPGFLVIDAGSNMRADFFELNTGVFRGGSNPSIARLLECAEMNSLANDDKRIR